MNSSNVVEHYCTCLKNSLHPPPPWQLNQVIIVIGIVLSVILYQIAVSAVVYIWLSRLGASSVASIGSIVASSTGSVVQLVFILIMGGVSGGVLLCGWVGPGGGVCGWGLGRGVWGVWG